MPKNRKGFILIVSYIVVTVLLILGAVYVTRSISEWRTAERDKDSLAAFYAAEAGVDYALDWLRAQASPPSGPPPNDIVLPAGPAIAPGVTYTVSVKPLTGNPTTYIKKYLIFSTGQSGDSQRRVKYTVQVDSFSRYTYFSDSEHYQGNPVWFSSSDTLNGPVHTNGHFHIANNPVFNDTVTSTDDFITYKNGGPPNDNPSFIPGQPQLGTDSISMPTQALDLRAAAGSGGMNLTGATTVTLQSNGTMNVTNSARGWSNTNMALPANGALFVNSGNLTISGTLSGRLSAGTSNSIIIPNNITYNIDPQINPNSTDMLGLIAERDIVIAQSTPFNLTIQSSVMAMNTSFYVDNWSGIPLKGTLAVYGGIIEKARGPVGTIWSSGSRRSGYGKNYTYDPRLRINPPPYYPTTGDYVTLSWREE